MNDHFCIKALIVDDEPHCREALQELLPSCNKNVRIVASAACVSEGLEVMKRSEIDLVFLDIHMGEESGFDFLNRTGRTDFSLIFTTAYDQYAIRAIRYSALDYLLKPVNALELQQAIVRVMALREKKSLKMQISSLLENYASSPKAPLSRVGLPSKNEIVFVSMDEILYCEADGFYTRFYFEGGREMLVTKNLKEYEEMLPSCFFRIHKSYLVNCEKIKKLIRSRGAYVVLNDNKTLPVSQRKKESLMTFLSGTHR